MSDGDHDFGPRGRSGFTRKGNLAAAADAVAAFTATLSEAR
jgi:predicted alpha/beta-hydrolase family hydrolase